MSGSRKAIWAVVGAVVVVSTIAGAGGMAMSLYANHRQKAQVEQTTTAAAAPKSNLARFAIGSLAALSTPAEAKSAPEYAFRDRTGTAVRFSAFQGKVVIVNLWAMWCAPCKAEMPTLQALAKAYETKEDLVVLPINVDATPEAAAEAKRFLADHAPLPFYSDAKFQLPFEFPGKGAMPQTIVLDRQGRIRAVMKGEADWSSPEARALIDAILAEGAAPPPA
ncbi:TlpA disulfide reductase family protein [Brevundimonas sp. SGAir0440]|uniref:TlpA family protein disulfide reductase n=1 Tax=Brevundimonas sp. SGAir0440 TaxID=2579977 RepID=UPI0010CD1810|nr:TlpA disulfide reductase family protein [Brevundimonas sp. SGAir0440]QCQ97663.1 TlpA family protein disulfide reductase [Brevundimonas sp. SGAir0440]